MGGPFDRLSEDWSGLNKVVIFGFGKMGQGNIEAFINGFQIVKIIDDNEAFKGRTYKGIEIVNLRTYINLGINEKIVVITSGKGYDSISKELKENGYKEFVDFCDFLTFCNDYFWNDRNVLFLGRLAFSVTTLCTLNCKNCVLLTPYNKNKKNFDLQQIKKDISMIFDVVDYVSNINILGGEPFLYKDLEELIIFFRDNYGDYIGNLQIVTNATLKPSESLLKVIKKYHVEVRISDYTQRVDYDEKLKAFCNDLDANQIDYITYTHDEWLDIGFPNEDVDMGSSVEELHKHMIKCDPNCHTVSEGKLYYCSQGWAADQSGLFQLKETDYLDLESISKCKDKKEKLRRYYFGDLEGGYFSFCKVCRGWDTDITVPGGIQYDDSYCL